MEKIINLTMTEQEAADIISMYILHGDTSGDKAFLEKLHKQIIEQGGTTAWAK